MVNGSDHLRVLVESLLEMDQSSTEVDALEAMMRALTNLRLGDALLSLYDSHIRKIKGKVAIGASWNSKVHSTEEDISGSGIVAVVLRSNIPEFIQNSDQDFRCRSQLTEESPIKAQYVLPIRLDDELIGTLQVDRGTESSIGDTEALVLQALVKHLAIGVSRIRGIRKSAELADHVMTSSRFVFAEALSGMAIHSLRHRVATILHDLEWDLRRKEVRQSRRLHEALTSWQKKLILLYEELEQTLTFVRGSREQENSPRTTDLHVEAINTVDMWSGFLRANAVTINLELEAINTFSPITPGAFREILSVLLVNSVQASARRIDVATYNNETPTDSPLSFIAKAFWLECRDDGTGLSTDLRESIFEPTYTTKPENLGTGLGLFVARGLARQSGGDLVLVSDLTAGSRGATFRLVLPYEEM